MKTRVDFSGRFLYNNYSERNILIFAKGKELRYAKAIGRNTVQNY